MIALGCSDARAQAAIYTVTYVEAVPNATRQAAVLHAGNLRFDVFVQTNRPNHFTVVECWKDQKAFSAHVAAKETRAFRDKLVSITGALYDERLYRSAD